MPPTTVIDPHTFLHMNTAWKVNNIVNQISWSVSQYSNDHQTRPVDREQIICLYSANVECVCTAIHLELYVVVVVYNCVIMDRRR